MIEIDETYSDILKKSILFVLSFAQYRPFCTQNGLIHGNIFDHTGDRYTAIYYPVLKNLAQEEIKRHFPDISEAEFNFALQGLLFSGKLVKVYPSEGIESNSFYPNQYRY